MPFDVLPDNIVSDLVKLRIARDGLANAWMARSWGDPERETYCTVGWLLKATEFNAEETARLVHDYVYPALPDAAKKRASKMWCVSDYNDTHRREDALAVLDRAIALATPAPMDG